MKTAWIRSHAWAMAQAGMLALLCSSSAFAQSNPSDDFKDFISSTFSPQTIAMPAVTAAGSQFIFAPAGFGTGAKGYGYHYGVSLADTVNGKFMRKFAFPVFSGQRDSYKPKQDGSFLSRIVNAAAHTIFVNPQLSEKSFNWSGIPASAASAALSNAYQPPQQRTWSATFVRIGTNSAGYLLNDVLLEFSAKPCRNTLLRHFWKCK